MTDRITQALRMGIVVLSGVLVVLAGLTVWHLVSQDQATPRSELDRAVLAAEQAVKSDPEDPTARVKLAAAYLERGNVRDAMEQARIAVRLAPDDPAGYYVLGLAEVRSGDVGAGISDLKTAAEKHGQVAPFYQDVWLAIARAYERQGDLEQAISAMSRALSYGPENAPLLFERGKLNEKAKRWMDAMDDYAAAIEYLPQHTEAQRRLDALKKSHPEEYRRLLETYGMTSTAEPTSKPTTATP